MPSLTVQTSKRSRDVRLKNCLQAEPETPTSSTRSSAHRRTLKWVESPHTLAWSNQSYRLIGSHAGLEHFRLDLSDLSLEEATQRPERSS
jgi:hypothetical protein